MMGGCKSSTIVHEWHFVFILFQIFGKLSANYVEIFRKSVLSSRFSVGFESRSIGSNA
jgi:hypothetical protein